MMPGYMLMHRLFTKHTSLHSYILLSGNLMQKHPNKFTCTADRNPFCEKGSEALRGIWCAAH